MQQILGYTLYYEVVLSSELIHFDFLCVELQRGENIAATVKYSYTVKSTGSGGLITKASAHERHYFSPFNVKGGNCKLKAV